MKIGHYTSWKSYSSLNSNQKRKEMLSSEKVNSPTCSFISPIHEKNKYSYHQANEIIKKENSLQVANQIELMNIKLSFELLQHKITRLNSIVIPNDYNAIERKRFKFKNKKVPPISNFPLYSSNLTRYKPTKFPKKLKDKSSLCSSADLSQIADDLVDTFDLNNYKLESNTSNHTNFNSINKQTNCNNEIGIHYNNVFNSISLKNRNDNIKRCVLNNKSREECIQMNIKTDKSQINNYKEESLKIANQQRINFENYQFSSKLAKNKQNLEELKIQKSNQIEVLPSINQSNSHQTLKETELSVKEIGKENKGNALLKQMDYREITNLTQSLKQKNDTLQIKGIINNNRKEKEHLNDDKKKLIDNNKLLFANIKNQIEEIKDETEGNAKNDKNHSCNEDYNSNEEAAEDENEDEGIELDEEENEEEDEDEGEHEEEEEEEDEEEEIKNDEFYSIKDSEQNKIENIQDNCQNKSDYSKLVKENNNQLPSPQIHLKNFHEEEKINTEDSYDDIFNVIIRKAKENSNNTKTTPQKQNQLENQSTSTKKSVSFLDKKRMIISYNANDPITKLSIIDSQGAKKQFEPVKIDQYFKELKPPIKLKSIITNCQPNQRSNALQSQNDRKIALDKLTSLLDECEDKENEKSPMKKNINIIQGISKLKKLGKSLQITKPKKKHIPKPVITCKKFADNPQKFFSEDLCENVLKSYNLDKNIHKKNSPRIEKKNDNNKGKNMLHKKSNSTGSIMYNIKKYFEEENVESDVVAFNEEHSIDIVEKNGFMLEKID